MKVFVARDHETDHEWRNGDIVICDKKPPADTGQFCRPMGATKIWIEMATSEFVTEFDFTPAIGSCKQMNLILTEIE